MTPNPMDNVCDWCDAQAVAAKEIRHKDGKGTLPTGRYVFACGEHTQQLERTIDALGQGKAKQ